MIVFNLGCAKDHKFEGWFASGEDFDAQRARGLLACPLCGSADVTKQLSAPRLNLHAPEPAQHRHERHEKAGGNAPVPAAPQPMAMLATPEQQILRELLRQVVENTEDVGSQFAEEARRIHYKEAQARAIRGVATREEAEALLDEGIEVAQLPLPAIDKSRLN